MSRITMPPSEALAQLIAECKQLDASEVGERWNQFNGAIAVAEMVLRDAEPAPEKPNPLAASLLDCPFCESPARRTGGHLGGISITTAQCSNDNCIAAFKSVDYAVWNHRAPVAAQPAAAPASVPEGFALVPLEPNDAMQAAGAGAIRFDTTVLNKLWTGNAVFRAMLAAAPLHESGSAAAVQEPMIYTMPAVSKAVRDAVYGIIGPGFHQRLAVLDIAGIIREAMQQPIEALTGHAEVDKMLETNQLDELGEEVARLQKALCFWLPSVTDREDEVALRILDDAFLLVGIDGNLPDNFKSAQELGWVSITAPAAAPAIAAPTEVERDAKRWRYSMDFQRKAGAPIPKAMTEMWRKVIDDNRTFPTVEEYEAATDAAIDAAIATGVKA